jgi:hypothetical protein
MVRRLQLRCGRMKASTGGFSHEGHVCGVDIGKTVFHLLGLSKEGHIVELKSDDG